jgi:hypothetical protein
MKLTRSLTVLLLAAALPLAADAQIAPPAPLFRADSVVPVTARFNMRALLRDRDPDSATWFAGSFTFDTGAAAVRVPARYRTRGIFRLRTCDLPPIRVRFEQDSVRGTPLDSLRRPKLATHCYPRDEYEQNLLQEYALYRVYQLFTPVSFAVRLLRVTYEDSAGAVRPLTRYGFFIEDESRFASRQGGRLLESVGILFSDLNTENAALVSVFQFFIANTDWSVPGRHNVELLRRDSVLLAIPYDFDWSGVINARYARPDPRLRSGTVRNRVYRGACFDAAVLEPVLARFEALKDSIAAVYRSVPGLEPRTIENALRYFDEFYTEIADRRRFQQRVERQCLRQTGG